jgi:hypothetical protein
MTTTNLSATYSVARNWSIPDELAKKLQANKDTELGLPYSWCIRWATLCYFDEEGKEHEVEPDDDDELDFADTDGIYWGDY